MQEIRLGTRRTLRQASKPRPCCCQFHPPAAAASRTARCGARLAALARNASAHSLISCTQLPAVFFAGPPPYGGPCQSLQLGSLGHGQGRYSVQHCRRLGAHAALRLEDERLEMETSRTAFVGCVHWWLRRQQKPHQGCWPAVSQANDDRHIEGQREVPMWPGAIWEPREEVAWAAHQHVG